MAALMNVWLTASDAERLDALLDAMVVSDPGDRELVGRLRLQVTGRFADIASEAEHLLAGR